MKIKNLTASAMELGDGRMIGAQSERKYGQKDLTERDKKRVKEGLLEIVETVPAATAEDTNKKEGKK